MTKTELPTKNDFQHAINELKALNNEIFYDDFKTRIKNLESHFEQMHDFVQNLSLSDKSNKEFLEQIEPM